MRTNARARRVAVITLFLAAGALAQEKGLTLYAKVGGAKVLQRASPSAKVLVQVKPGEAVQWLGAAAADRRYQEVETQKGQRGFVLLQQLTPYAVAAETSPEGRKLDAQAFAATGAHVSCRLPPHAPGRPGRPQEYEMALQSAEAVAGQVGDKDAQAWGCRSTGGCR